MASRRASPRSLVLRLLFAIELIVLLLIARQWAYVTTYRLYLDRATDAARLSGATQVFELNGQRVSPRITMREPERLAFHSPTNAEVTLNAEVQALKAVRYTIAGRRGDRRVVLATGTAEPRALIAQAVPRDTDLLELESDGAATWIDPRIVREMHVLPHFAVLLLLVSLSWMLNVRATEDDRSALRRAWFKTAALTVAAGTALVSCEVVLRALGDHAPAGLLALRHDLGEATPDERWEDTPRYGRRLRALVNAENAWQYGDIVRMGFVPAAVGPGVWHRFPFRTDAEGFRNTTAREQFDIAALGDSFTDALTVPAQASWPARLEQRLGVRVQNYGNAGFGPQQELLVLQDFAIRHRPKRVVLAYFAGNDIFDAERFDRRQRGIAADQTLGWPIKNVYSRADTWFVTSAFAASAGWVAGGPQPFVLSAEEHAADGPIQARRPFDRGLFSVEVNGRLLQWAFMPPYLNTMNFSERELRGRTGWTLTRDAISKMNEVSRAAGAEFVVMFLPFKSQVYWPLLERSLSPEELHRALAFYLEGNGRPIDVELMRRNRLVQNALLRDFCAQAGIPFLDTTPVLQARVDAGENVYFPDESHLNETGQALVADALAGFLQAR